MDEIKKINISSLKKIKNPKGDILHALKHTDSDYYGFGEAYFSTIIKNQIKGWNRHKKMIINLIVPYGKVRFVVYDDEPNSKQKFKSYILSSNEYNRLRFILDFGLLSRAWALLPIWY